MARLHEHQSRALLAIAGVPGPRAGAEPSPDEALDIAHALSVSLTIDDAARAPVIHLAMPAAETRLPVRVDGSIDADRLNAALEPFSLPAASRAAVADAIRAIAACARLNEARAIEVNPLAVLEDGRIVAADCRISIDDNAIFRHPDLSPDAPHELARPPTPLERIAHRADRADPRGSLFFTQLPVSDAPRQTRIGFHGAGAGGAMKALDAISAAGFAPANFSDVSADPSPAKVYAAARIILAQPHLAGYFGCGSGADVQEQRDTAYGLAKAFLELRLSVPALIRLGGAGGDAAARILEDACGSLPARVEAYGRDHATRFIADRFHELVDEAGGARWTPCERRTPAFVGSPDALSLPLRFGQGWRGAVWIDLARCTPDAAALIAESSGGVLESRDGRPALAIDPDEAMTKDSEMIRCEIECFRAAAPFVFVDCPIPGLDAPADPPAAEASA